MGLSYRKAIESNFSRAEVLRELKKHEADLVEFFEDCGDLEEYPGAVVLSWMGYLLAGGR